MIHFDTSSLSRETAAQTLAAWQSRDAELRLAMREPGVARPEQVAGLSGLQVFEAMFRGELPYPPIARTLDFGVAHVSHGRADFLGRPSFAHYNPLGSVHGGWIATLLDSAVGCAVQSMLPQGTGYTTLELKVNLIRALTDKTGPVRAEGKVIQVGRSVGIAEGRLFDVDGKLYAHATTTCLVFPLP